MIEIGKYKANNKLYILCRGLFWTQMSILMGFMKNVTYATPLMAQINIRKCMLLLSDDSEYNGAVTYERINRTDRKKAKMFIR